MNGRRPRAHAYPIFDSLQHTFENEAAAEDEHGEASEAKDEAEEADDSEVVEKRRATG